MTVANHPPLRHLLPALFAGKDAQQPGEPLLALLEVLDGELEALDAAVRALHDDHFVERASVEALPLLAELFGARLLGSDPGTNRAVIARSVSWRRRRGNLAALEEVLSATSGWSAEVDEGFRSLLFTQDHRAPTPERGRLPALWDPIPLADPLARRPARADRRRDQAAAETLLISVDDSARSRRGEDDVLRRMGRADAGRYATSPRTVDLRGWARPEGVLVRAARLFPVELEGVVPGPVVERTDGRRVFTLDPLGRGGPMVWRQPLERADLIPELTGRHEPDGTTTDVRRAALLLTPTALAADPAAVEASGDVQVAVAGVALVGPMPIVPPRAPVEVKPAGPSPDLRLADPARVPEGQRLTLTLVGQRSDGERDLLSVIHTGGAAVGTSPLTVNDDARRALPGTTAALRVRREGGRGARRGPGAGGTWSAHDVAPRLGPVRGPAVLMVVGGQAQVVRPEGAPDGTLRLTSLPVATPSVWQAVSLAGASLPPERPGLAVASTGSDDRLVVIGDDGSGALGAWLVTMAAAPAVVVRLDDPGQRQPPARFAPAACLLADGTLFVHGGFQGHSPRGDLWSLETTAAGPVPWRFVHARQAPQRGEATLLPAFGGLVLIGGQADRGKLERNVLFCVPDSPRPTWRPLEPLPLDTPASRPSPGMLAARLDASGGIEALVWDDRTRPVRMNLTERPGRWTRGPLEPAPAPSPPASGEAVFLADGTLLCAGPPPVPPSEVMFALGGDTNLVYLPALDFADGQDVTFAVSTDGTASRLRPEGDLPLEFTRGPHEPLDERPGEGKRLGVPGRLGRQLFELRQRILGDANDPALLPDLDHVVGLDPRSSRVILPAGAPPGALSVSYVVGRGGPIGAGALPVDRRLAPFWEEPDMVVPNPPDLPTGPGLPAAAEVTAWVSPSRAGQALAQRGQERPVVATLAEALALAREVAHPVLAVLGSARLPPARLESRSRRGFSLVAADFGSTPLVVAPDDPDLPSLALHAGAAVGADADGIEGDPTDALWVAGLWIAGRTDITIARGRLDFRFCTLGEPGSLALRVAGAGHQGLLGRRSLHPVEVELRLYGCQLGAVEVPPWVRLVAAGCSFDAGSNSASALLAAGAQVRLRHCTVRGATLAGELRASSSVFSGPVRADRPDLGWVRYSLLRATGAEPRTHHCLDHTPSFNSLRPLDPTYLVLAENNGPAALAAGEEGRLPGAFADRHQRERELLARTEMHLPIGLRAQHLDRSPLDLARMGRRAP